MPFRIPDRGFELRWLRITYIDIRMSIYIYVYLYMTVKSGNHTNTTHRVLTLYNLQLYMTD